LCKDEEKDQQTIRQMERKLFLNKKNKKDIGQGLDMFLKSFEDSADEDEFAQLKYFHNEFSFANLDGVDGALVEFVFLTSFSFSFQEWSLILKSTNPQSIFHWKIIVRVIHSQLSKNLLKGHRTPLWKGFAPFLLQLAVIDIFGCSSYSAETKRSSTKRLTYLPPQRRTEAESSDVRLELYLVFARPLIHIRRDFGEK
jgi:hypothetical protein